MIEIKCPICNKKLHVMESPHLNDETMFTCPICKCKNRICDCIQDNEAILPKRYKILNICHGDEFLKKYKAIDSSNNVVIVIVIALPDYKSTETKEEIVKKLKELQKLNIPSTIKIIEVLDNGVLGYVEEYYEGDTLRDLIKKQGPFSENEVESYILYIVKVLHEFHNKGLNHAEIIPDNVIVTHGGQVLVSCVGLEHLKDRYWDVAHINFETNSFAPFFTDSFNPWADAYSICMMWYYLTTGHYPPPASEVLEDLILSGKDLDHIASMIRLHSESSAKLSDNFIISLKDISCRIEQYANTPKTEINNNSPSKKQGCCSFMLIALILIYFFL